MELAKNMAMRLIATTAATCHDCHDCHDCHGKSKSWLLLTFSEEEQYSCQANDECQQPCEHVQ